MLFNSFLALSVAALAAAGPSFKTVPTPTPSEEPCEPGTIICVDSVNECGIGYGGCYDVCGPAPPSVTQPPPCPTCGLGAGQPCPEGLFCRDNPDDGCDPEGDGINCPGTCVTPTPVPLPSPIYTVTPVPLPSPIEEYTPKPYRMMARK